MTTLEKAAQQALEALEKCVKALDALHARGDSIYTRASDLADRAEIALRAALAQQQEQEPVAWACFKNGELQTELVGTEADVNFWCASDEPEMEGMVKGTLYTHPPRREWVSLTEEEIRELSFHNQQTLWPRPDRSDVRATAIPFARAIEAALKERNT